MLSNSIKNESEDIRSHSSLLDICELISSGLGSDNFAFDNNVIQAEYYRNNQINWLGRHRKIEYCTMKYGKPVANIKKPSKFHNGMYIKSPKLEELYYVLFKTRPSGLHNAMIDVIACFRCFHEMLYGKDIFSSNATLSNYYKAICAL